MSKERKVEIIESFFIDLTVGKVYDAYLDKEGLWIENDWKKDIWLNLHNEYNKELIKYKLVK